MGTDLLLSLVGLGATAFATAWFYRIDEVITVKGRLVPQQGGVEVKSPVNGQLNEVLVKSGDQVKREMCFFASMSEKQKCRNSL